MLRGGGGMPFVNSAVGHQRQEELAILKKVGAHIAEVACHAFVDLWRRAKGARSRDRAEAKRASAISGWYGFECARAAIAIEPQAGTAVSAEVQREARGIGYACRALSVVHRLDGDELPVSAGERGARRRSD